MGEVWVCLRGLHLSAGWTSSWTRGVASSLAPTWTVVCCVTSWPQLHLNNKHSSYLLLDRKGTYSNIPCLMETWQKDHTIYLDLLSVQMELLFLELFNLSLTHLFIPLSKGWTVPVSKKLQTAALTVYTCGQLQTSSSAAQRTYRGTSIRPTIHLTHWCHLILHMFVWMGYTDITDCTRHATLVSMFLFTLFLFTDYIEIYIICLLYSFCSYRPLRFHNTSYCAWQDKLIWIQRFLSVDHSVGYSEEDIKLTQRSICSSCSGWTSFYTVQVRPTCCCLCQE